VHEFHVVELEKIFNKAKSFLESMPLEKMPEARKADPLLQLAFESGAGIYAIYYFGDFKHYRKISGSNVPIYVGKAVIPGSRTARVAARTNEKLVLKRILEHGRSIADAKNLNATDFQFKYLVLQDTAAHLVQSMESHIISCYQPLWNGIVDGFGNHDPGKGRYNQAVSQWDLLHPGRAWVKKLKGESTLEGLDKKIQAHLKKVFAQS
jgi:hypothetical protein